MKRIRSGSLRLDIAQHLTNIVHHIKCLRTTTNVPNFLGRNWWFRGATRSLGIRAFSRVSFSTPVSATVSTWAPGLFQNPECPLFGQNGPGFENGLPDMSSRARSPSRTITSWMARTARAIVGSSEQRLGRMVSGRSTSSGTLSFGNHCMAH